MNRRGRPVAFQPGDEVEVRLDSKGFHGAWYEARVAGHHSVPGRYVVVYDSLVEEADLSRPLRETVRCSRLRPRPPRGSDGPFSLNQLVDAFYNEGWWAGVVSEVPGEHEAGDYTVSFPNAKEKIKFRPALLRRHLKWGNGEWVRPREKAFIRKKVYDWSKKRAENPLKFQTLKDEFIRKCPETSSKGSDVTMPGSNSHLKTFLKDSGERKLASGKRRKKSIPCKSLPKKERIIDTKASSIGDSMDALQENKLVSEPSVEGHSTPQTKPVTEGDAIIKDLDGHELSNMMVVTSSSIFLGKSNSSHSQHNEGGGEPPNVTPSKRLSLPFEKRSPMWEYIDSEVISKMRQKPHFRPLEQLCEVQREGMAIGLMVTYDNLVNSKGGLKMVGSRHRFEENVKILTDLEEHGFEVQHARARLEELLRIESHREQLLRKSSTMKVQVLEKKEKSDQLDADLETIDKAVMAMELAHTLFCEKRTSLSKQKEENDSIMAKLQMDFKLAEEELQSAECAFQDVLAAAW